jgi:Fic family protein
MQNVTYPIWMLLGKAQAKVEHIASSPLMPEVAEEFRSVYMAKGALATTAIEGNTLTEDQVMQRIARKLDLPPSKEYLGIEIDNVIEAYNLIGTRVLEENTTQITPEMLKEYNRLVLQDLPLGEDVVPGEFRQHQVTVGRYQGAPSEDVETLVEQFCQWLNTAPFALKGYEYAFGLLKAIIAHVYIAWIHPFGDGNGCTARLIEFQILLAAGVPDTAAHLLSNFYNETRSEYYRQLDKTSREWEADGLFAFVEYALQGFIDNLNQQIEVIQGQQLQIHWRNYIYDLFKHQDSTSATRRRRLLLDLSEYYLNHDLKPVPVSELRYISTRLAESYASKTQKTIQRDVNMLVEMGLIGRTAQGIVPRLELLQGFMPQKKQPPEQGV